MDDFATRPDPHTVEFVRILPGPIERIWDFIADGKKRGEWFASGDLPEKVGQPFTMRFKHSELSPNQAPAAGKIHRDGQMRPHLRATFCWPARSRIFWPSPSGRKGATARKWNSA